MTPPPSPFSTTLAASLPCSYEHFYVIYCSFWAIDTCAPELASCALLRVTGRWRSVPSYPLPSFSFLSLPPPPCSFSEITTSLSTRTTFCGAFSVNFFVCRLSVAPNRRWVFIPHGEFQLCFPLGSHENELTYRIIERCGTVLDGMGGEVDRLSLSCRFFFSWNCHPLWDRGHPSPLFLLSHSLPSQGVC